MITPETEKIRTDLNPAVFTSLISLMGGADCGDRDAIKVLGLVENDENFLRKRGFSRNLPNNNLYRFSKACGETAWIRSKISEILFESLRMTTFIDLGCGMSSRGYSFIKKGYIRYYGIDLPSVIERMKRTVIPVGKSADKVMYFAADVTDLDALRSAVRSDEPVFIVTESLIPYLTESEMKTVIGNIAFLLREYGGVWFTGDNTEHSLYGGIIRKMLGVEERELDSVLGADILADIKKLYFDNSFIKLKDEEMSGFFGSFGLKCQKTGLKYLMQDLKMSDIVREAFEKTEFLIMTPAEKRDTRSDKVRRSAFGLEIKEEDGTASVVISGRLDAINAPKLIEEYEAQNRSHKADEVVLDMADCTYISSAGLRAVLMIYKRTSGNHQGFSIKNITPEVFEIMKTTGFTDIV